MKNKGSLYVGLMILLLGGVFLVLNLGTMAFGSQSVFGISRLWPLFILWIGLGFFLPLLIWWERRERIYGLAMPGAIIVINGLLLLYSSMTRDWNAWAYLWTLEPLSIAVGLLLLYALGARAQGVLIGALIVGGVSLALFAIFVSLLGGTTGAILGALLLIILGIVMVGRALMERRPAG